VSAPDPVAVLGAGMHPWGKWGRPFHEYGVDAALAALDDAGVDWADVQFVAGGETVRNGYPGYVAASTLTQALGWNGARVASCYAACASGATAIEAARTRILAGLCDVALVVGADTTPKGFLAPVAGERWDDPDWLRFRLLGATNPTYFALYARRRMDLYGATEADFAKVKVKNARHGLNNPYARYRKEVTEDEVLASPMVADPLRLLEICATSDGAAAIVLSSMDYAKAKGIPEPVRIRAVSTVTPRFPNTVIEMPNFATDSAAAAAPPELTFRDSIAAAAYEEAGIGPEEMSLAEVYDLSTALELDWYENIGLCKEGEAEKLLNDGDTTIGGRIPVNPSGGLACFGEAVPAQAIAQVCELTWQLRGQAGARQVEGATAGITVNQGLFGHGSSVLLTT
jgi:acetyl-CoA acetyltransferase